ncbi:hypothetical protein RUND412_007263 [Rhizina undulata]
MPAFFEGLFKRGNAGSKKSLDQEADVEAKPVQPEDGWLRTQVSPEEVQELLRGCTQEIKSRGLSTPFLLLPFRPNSDASPARTFIRNFFNTTTGPLSGALLQQELRLTEPVVLCSALKWCWSRLPRGVVTWDVYEMFRKGELDSGMARDSFSTFIPMSAESEARSKIIFDFFDLLSAIAAHGKHNGLGGIKLSRLAGWWAFEHSDFGWGFEGGYTSWSRAADATSHLFFAYLRSLSPAEGAKGVSIIPISLKALLASVDYPPVKPPQLQSKTVRVVMTVENVSPTPYALLRRAKNFRYTEDDLALQIFLAYEDPILGLTDECKRVMKCISAANQQSSKAAGGAQDQSWSRFQDLGFAGLQEESESSDGDGDGLSMTGSDTFRRRRASTQPAPSTPQPPRSPEFDIARPQTPSWADFMNSGFGDRDQPVSSPPPLVLPPDKILPPIETRLRTSQSNRVAYSSLDPGELSNVIPIEVDDAFWWVWISSLASEESSIRKAVFGRCALVETVVKGGRWLVIEEKVKGAATGQEEAAFLAAKKESKISRMMKLSRRRSVGNPEVPIEIAPKVFDPSTISFPTKNITQDQAARIQNAAAALKQQHHTNSHGGSKRTPEDSNNLKYGSRVSSGLMMPPLVMSEATSAMKWANKYDRDATKDQVPKGESAPEKKSITSKIGKERELPALPTERKVEGTNIEDERSLAPTPVPKSPPVSPKSVSSRRDLTLGPPSITTQQGRVSPAPENRSLPSPVSPKALPNPKSDKPRRHMTHRLKTFFGKKSDASVPETKGTNSNGLGVPSQSLRRKVSLVRKKQIPIEESDVANPDSPAKTASVSQTSAVSVPVSPVTPSTPALEVESQANSGEAGSSNEEQEAVKPVSAFTQGPLEDQPMFVAVDSLTGSPEISEPVSPVEPQTTVAPLPVPISPTSPVDSIATNERWAQIRKNASEKVKASVTASDVGASMDEENNSEETIESRVARIKARVAELTNNMDTPQPSTSS